jgi:hypothetical protein
MSYDVTFFADVGAGDDNPDLEDGWRNYTSNVSGMWYRALGGVTLGDLLDPEPVARDLEPTIRRAIGEMMESPEVFRAMNPPNGWGDYDGALAFLVWIADKCRDWPTAKVRVWR